VIASSLMSRKSKLNRVIHNFDESRHGLPIRPEPVATGRIYKLDYWTPTADQRTIVGKRKSWNFESGGKTETSPRGERFNIFLAAAAPIRETIENLDHRYVTSNSLEIALTSVRILS